MRMTINRGRMKTLRIYMSENILIKQKTKKKEKKEKKKKKKPNQNKTDKHRKKLSSREKYPYHEITELNERRN